MPLQPRIPQGSPGPAWRKASPPQPTPTMDWRWRRLLDAPHRLGFAFAALLLALSALWWTSILILRTFDLALPWAVPPSLAHGMLLTWGFMPLFITGFLFTAGPRWLQSQEVATRELAPAVLLYSLSVGWMVAGFHVGQNIAACGLLGMALAWAALCTRYTQLFLQSRVQDKVHATFILLACWCGLLGLMLSGAGVAKADSAWVRSGIHVGLWCCMATVFAAVSHRMIPFFTASALPFLDAWRPLWLLWSMVCAVWWVAMGSLLELWWWPLPSPVYGLLAMVELVAGILFLWLAIRWGLVQSLKIRLLAMLHGGFVWLGLGMGMLAAHHGWLALHHAASPWGLAPLHALTMGYLGTSLLAMATRVAAGHSGRPLAADNLAWALYWTAQLAVALRLAAVLPGSQATVLLLSAITLWTVATGGWALRYGRWFGQPRFDGKPG